MAASGIAEHLEARRRQRQMNKKAAWILDKLETEELQARVDEYRQQETEKLNTYQKQLSGRNNGQSNANSNSTDQERRDALRREQMVEYTAKIPNRYNSTNYSQQW